MWGQPPSAVRPSNARLLPPEPRNSKHRAHKLIIFARAPATR